MITHPLVRLVLGAAVVALFAIMAGVFSPAQAVFAAAGFAWLLAVALPHAVIAERGRFPWALAVKLWAWSAADLVTAGLIGRALGFPLGAAAG